MESTLTYTVAQGDGYLTIARYIFSQSPRPYIQSLVNRYDLMKEVAKKIESDLTSEYLNFKLTVGQKVKVLTDPGYYIPRLAVVAKHDSLPAQAKKKATTTVQDDCYFVIHSTVSGMSDSKLKIMLDSKKKGAGHAYIKKDGTIVQIWPYNDPNGWATKAEYKKPELRGKLVNIELIYKEGESPTEQQYQALANIYLETNKLFNKWLSIVSHREVDRGIPDGHEDPKEFKFNHFYEILKSNNVPIDDINKQSQDRFNQMPWCEHTWTWPPILDGLKFKRVSADVFKTKECEGEYK